MKYDERTIRNMELEREEHYRKEHALYRAAGIDALKAFGEDLKRQIAKARARWFEMDIETEARKQVLRDEGYPEAVIRIVAGEAGQT